MIPREYSHISAEFQTAGIPSQSWALELEAGEIACVRGTRAICAWTLMLGIGPACRARISTACAEILDNASRHAYGDDGGKVWIEARKLDRELLISIEDRGAGMEPAVSTCTFGPEWGEGGFRRAASLAERLELESAAGLGTSVRLRFCTYKVYFEEELQVDLSDLDFLPPTTASALIERLRTDVGDSSFYLSPALALTVGRLLMGPLGRSSTVARPEV